VWATARKITEEENASRTGLFCKSRSGKKVEEMSDIADEISCLNGAREVTTKDVRDWMSSKRHAARKT
jgi:hypothetical protein